MNNSLVLKSINELLGENFFIPAYQRGYRWTEKQVTDLLDDIWEFLENPPKQEDGEEKPFYCLQPIVVKQFKEDQWEVIDGQQRLATIFLILKSLENLIDGDKKNFKSIIFETRKNSEHYLNNISEKDKNDNVDYFHIYNSNLTIIEWFKKKANNGFPNARVKFLTPFIENTKVIWYQVNDGSDAVDIFTRINMGKIPLTNAELIKALFLRKGNFAKENEDKIRLKQLQIAGEWDRIEYALQDDSFWYFIRNNSKNYPTRIEYIFDLMKNKAEEDEEYFTFHKFNKDFEETKDIDQIWMDVKKYFLTFEEWYRDRELYHLIGFLVAIGSEISYLKSNSEAQTKTQYKSFLKNEIKKKVNFQIDDLEYPDPLINRILLLFNIQTILSNNESNIRFPFSSFKNENWDIEHIRSIKSDKPSGKKQRKWLEDVLVYLTGENETEKQTNVINILNSDEKKLSLEIYNLLMLDTIPDNDFNEIYEKLLIYFKEDNEPENINFISNLALLDSRTNRGYKNAVFPIKRKTIIENDMKGTFIPICTKNVFLKSYSTKLDGVMFWQDRDSKDYLTAIKSILSVYLPPQNK